MYTIGTTKITVAGNEIDFGDENWERINYVDKMRELLGFDFLEIEDYNVLAENDDNPSKYKFNFTSLPLSISILE